MIGGIASLWLPERFSDPAYRAFSAYLLASILALWVYTAAKSTYLLSSLQPAIEERNLFFLSPLLLIGTALVLYARKVSWPLVVVATVLVMVTVWSGMFEVGPGYFEAPGLAILTLVNRDFHWDVNAFHVLLGAAALVSIVLLALRHRRGVGVLAAVLAGAWLMTGQIYATIGNTTTANSYAKKIPAPRDWVDQLTGGAHVTFLGQSVTDGIPLWLTEFWNRSVSHVASLNGVAPGPGPISAPGLETTDGALSGYTGDPFTLAGNGVKLAAPIVAARDEFVLYRTPTRWHLLNAEQNVYTDGWATSPIYYTYFPRGGPGTVVVVLSRSGYRGAGKPVIATIRAGTVKLDSNGVPELDRVTAVEHAVVRNGHRTVVRMHVRIDPGHRDGQDADLQHADRLAAARRAAELQVRAGPALAPEPNRAKRRIARMSRAASPKATISSPAKPKGVNANVIESPAPIVRAASNDSAVAAGTDATQTMPATANMTEPAVARTRPQPRCALAQPPRQSNGW